MKDENAFNAFLKKEFKKHSEYKALKVSDRFKIGIPDWLIFHTGCAVAVECKFTKNWNYDKNLLKHPVSQPQLSTLTGFYQVGVPAAVLIGIDDTCSMLVGSHKSISKVGNASGRDLREGGFQEFDMSEVYAMLKYLFYDFPKTLREK